ncbi:MULTISPECIES: hypothetical protein [unclassified Streptomyces]|uniref:hypothetical protein n=1 Tax=unclassified Streptomyces TaxID=2593676 RepID=UPI0038211306
MLMIFCRGRRCCCRFWICLPGFTGPVRAVYLHGLQELGVLVATQPRECVVRAAWKQMRRLAVETGLAKYVEVRAVLDGLERGEAVLPPDRSGPLVQRLRALIVQSDAHRDDFRRWAVEKMVCAVWGSPHRAVYEIATTRRRLSVDWRAELLADLGNPPVPPMPDGRFWGALRNPDVDSRSYAARYA